MFRIKFTVIYSCTNKKFTINIYASDNTKLYISSSGVDICPDINTWFSHDIDERLHSVFNYKNYTTIYKKLFDELI